MTSADKIVPSPVRNAGEGQATLSVAPIVRERVPCPKMVRISRAQRLGLLPLVKSVHQIGKVAKLKLAVDFLQHAVIRT